MIHILVQELATIAPFVASIGAIIGAIYSKQSSKKLFYETAPNGGNSLRDQLNSINRRLEIDEENTIQYRQALDKRLCVIENQLYHKNNISKKPKHKKHN